MHATRSRKHILPPIPPCFHKHPPNKAERESVLLWHLYRAWAAAFWTAEWLRAGPEVLWPMHEVQCILQYFRGFCLLSALSPKAHYWGYTSKVKPLSKIPLTLLWWIIGTGDINRRLQPHCPCRPPADAGTSARLCGSDPTSRKGAAHHLLQLSGLSC